MGNPVLGANGIQALDFVARKLTILAREIGRNIEIGEFPVQSLVPEALRDCSIEEFLDRLSDYDGDMQAMYEEARAAGKSLRYVGRLDEQGNAAVGLESVGSDHPFSHIALTDNIVQFETDRYSANPLVVQGPGAGPEVTVNVPPVSLAMMCARVVFPSPGGP